MSIEDTGHRPLSLKWVFGSGLHIQRPRLKPHAISTQTSSPSRSKQFSWPPPLGSPCLQGAVWLCKVVFVKKSFQVPSDPLSLRGSQRLGRPWTLSYSFAFKKVWSIFHCSAVSTALEGPWLPSFHNDACRSPIPGKRCRKCLPKVAPHMFVPFPLFPVLLLRADSTPSLSKQGNHPLQHSFHLMSCFPSSRWKNKRRICSGWSLCYSQKTICSQMTLPQG